MTFPLDNTRALLGEIFDISSPLSSSAVAKELFSPLDLFRRLHRRNTPSIVETCGVLGVAADFMKLEEGNFEKINFISGAENYAEVMMDFPGESSDRIAEPVGARAKMNQVGNFLTGKPHLALVCSYQPIRTDGVWDGFRYARKCQLYNFECGVF